MARRDPGRAGGVLREDEAGSLLVFLLSVHAQINKGSGNLPALHPRRQKEAHRIHPAGCHLHVRVPRHGPSAGLLQGAPTSQRGELGGSESWGHGAGGTGTLLWPGPRSRGQHGGICVEWGPGGDGTWCPRWRGPPASCHIPGGAGELKGLRPTGLLGKTLWKSTELAARAGDCTQLNPVTRQPLLPPGVVEEASLGAGQMKGVACLGHRASSWSVGHGNVERRCYQTPRGWLGTQSMCLPWRGVGRPG